MKKISLSINEFYLLNAELNGGEIQTNLGSKSFEGFINQELTLVQKYWLNDINKKIKEEVGSCEKLKEELVKKYGEVAEDKIQISMYIKDENGNDVSNPNYAKFNEEFLLLLQESRFLEYKELNINELGGIKTKDNYEILYKLFNVE